LSAWFENIPLSPERIKELKQNSAARIERYRNTMRIKRDGRQAKAFEKAARDISILSKREIILCGLFLYWGEGEKSNRATISLSNTEKFWSEELGLPLECFRKPYIKKSNLAGLTYKNGFGHGTAMIRYGNKELQNYVSMALKYIRNL
jgi:hypothetical protein